MRYMNARAGRAREIAGVKDYQLGRLIDRIDNQANQPTLVLGGGGMSGNKDKLARIALRPKAVDGPDTSF